MDEKKSAAAPLRVILVLAAIALTVYGQIALYATPIQENMVLPAPAWVSLAGIFLFVFALWLPSFPLLKKLNQQLGLQAAGVWVLAALIFVLLAAFAAYQFERRGLFNFIPVVSFWLLGAFCYLMAFLPADIFRRDWRAWFWSHRREILWVGLVEVLAVALRFYKLGALPRVINGDEARIGLVAIETAHSALANPFALWENIGAFYLQAINFFFGLFGVSAFSLRLSAAIAGSLAIFSTYLFARQVAGKRIALMTIFLLATSHTHIHFSRTVAVSYIQGVWLLPLEFYLLLSGLEKRSAWRAALSGVIIAIHLSIYISAQMALGLLLIYLLIAFLWLKKESRPSWQPVTAFLGGFFITAIPEISYILRTPDEFLNRLNENGTYSGWLALEVAATGKSSLQILLERVIHAFLSMIYYPAIEFYGSPAPVLSFVSAVLFLLGLGYVLWRARSAKFLLLNGYFWGCIVSIGLFAIPPSSDSYRVLIALPAALLIAAIALDQILERLGLGWSASPFTYAAISAVLMFGLFAFNYWVYYFDFAGNCRYGGDKETRFASYLGTYVKSVSSEEAVYLLSDDIFRYGTHASVDFLTGRRPIINVPDPLDSLNPVSQETIIASPDRIEELRAWARAHPGGNLHTEYDCQNLILAAYQLP
ncbi:MAG: hypothetical protein OHK0031_02670 [Anaerolineales bacterium]